MAKTNDKPTVRHWSETPAVKDHVKRKEALERQLAEARQHVADLERQEEALAAAELSEADLDTLIQRASKTAAELEKERARAAILDRALVGAAKTTQQVIDETIHETLRAMAPHYKRLARDVVERVEALVAAASAMREYDRECLHLAASRSDYKEKRLLPIGSMPWPIDGAIADLTYWVCWGRKRWNAAGLQHFLEWEGE